MYLAHSATETAPNGHPLAEHLRESAAFAKTAFGEGETQAFSALAADVAQFHDAGKYKDAFQERLNGNLERVDHSTLGGQLLKRRYGEQMGRLLAYAILGHHGGLPDGIASEGPQRRSLEQRLNDPVDEAAAQRFFSENPLPPPPKVRLKPCKSQGFEMTMLARMTHSALVDADYLDTERYFEPERFYARAKSPPLTRLLSRYENYMKELEDGATDPQGIVNRMRRKVRADCEKAASLPKGFFTLTVPTGGGKTLSSLGFALRHAAAHAELRRIVYAIPFTSIIEQNADVFVKAVGAENVLEHHSSVNWTEGPRNAQLAAENWDAPLIVTTNVQLFESLFADNPAKCRKNHNLANAILILDEAQALPDALLKPCLQALCSLVRNYGATVVICTATQPDLSNVWPEKPEIREIVEDVPALFEALKRTRATMLGTLSDDALLSRITAHEQALCVVNTRAHAQKLFRALPKEEGVYHLSALMCPEHRTKKLDEIRKRLKSGERCIIFSTSLIEAGVDIDVPFVYRERAGLDSVAQAAGRCNRNGRLKMGEVYVFQSEEETLPPYTKKLGAYLDEIARLYPDVMSREAISHFFRLRFSGGGQVDPLDAKNILGRIEEHKRDIYFPFAQIAYDFRMIQSAGEPLFIPYDETARENTEKLRLGDHPYAALRALRRYAVTLYPNAMRSLREKGYVLNIGDAAILDASEEQMKLLYTEDCGLDVDADMAPLFDHS